MSIIYSPKQVSTDLQDAIAKFLKEKEARVIVKQESAQKRKARERREEAREEFLAKREREHMKLVDARG